MLKYFYPILFFLANGSLYAQKLVIADTLKSLNLSEVVITATRNEKQISALPMPVTLISQQQIKQMGSLRLNDVLSEQTGLVIVADHGQGVQVQGFGPEYTLILIDGEPLVGRTAGTLELNRITVGNIKQIEIVKGPSSSLYGSEALAGVINIITEKPDGIKGNISTRYGSNRTSDFSGNFSYKLKKLGISIFGNRYQTGGYDLSPASYGNTIDPFHNYTFNSKLTYDFSARTKLSVSGRYFIEKQTSAIDVGETGNPQIITGTGTVKDWNFNPFLTHHFSNKFKTIFRFYSSSYHTGSTQYYQSDSKIYDESVFTQSFTRPEISAEYAFNPNNVLTVGIGYIAESVEATRYDDKKRFNTKYRFFQYEWIPVNKFSLILGGRYDAHSAYNSQFSPKISAQYDLNRWLAVRGSVGVGFKAPDFRQLYLNFTNASVGYSVFGSQEVASQVARLQAENQIEEIFFNNFSVFDNIRPESSVAYNFGFKMNPVPKLKSNINFFRNDIKDLIETVAVAQKTNKQSVFSYYNISRVFTRGVEADISYQLNKSVSISGGYQYLEAKDKAIVEQIKQGEVYRRDPVTLVTTRVKMSDYGGLFNRSKHSANIKLFYNDVQNGFSASLRGIYRGRYGLGDLNNNTILDADNEYVKGYMTWNASVGKNSMKNKLKSQVGVDNIFGFTDAKNISTIPGRLFYASLQYSFGK